MIISFRAFLLTILFMLAVSVYGQQPVFRHYKVDDGLPSSEVYHVFQDSKRFIWLATNMGVSRFDGKKFRNFDVQDGLPENTVFEIYEDETGRVWFVGFPFQLAYYEHDSIVEYKYNDVLEKISGNSHVPVKKSFRASSDGGVYFTFFRSDAVLHITPGGEIQRIKGKDQDFNGISIFDMDNQVFIYQSGENTDEKLKVRVLTRTSSNEISVTRSKNYSFGNLFAIKGSGGDIYFAYNELLTKIQPDGDYYTVNIRDRLIWMNLGERGNLWIGTEKKGISVYKDGRLEGRPIKTYLEGLSVSSMLTDREGGRWFSTLEDGVFYLASESFNSFREVDGLTYSKINTVTLAGEKLVLGMSDPYINIIWNNKVSQIKISESPNGVINAVEPDENNNLWIGTNDYLYYYDQDKVTKYVNNHDIFKVKNVNSRKIFNIKDLLFDDGRLHIGEASSFTLMNKSKVIYNSFFDENIEIRVEAIEKAGESVYLLGTLKGLWRYSKGRYDYLGSLNPILKNRITDIEYIEKSKTIIAGTKGYGILIYSEDTTINISGIHGLSSNSVTSLLITGNLLWVATNNGLNLLELDKVGTSKMKIVVFSKQHGLISNEINQIAGNPNAVYIATNEGLTVFDYNNYQPVKDPPPVYIDAFSIMNRDMVVSSGQTFRYNQNFVTLRYTGISYRDAGNLIYKYRLKGLNPEWTSTSNSQVEYAFLPPGKYDFEVLAVNSDGLQSNEVAAISFVILPPIWSRWWFYSLLALFALALVFLFYYYRLRRIRKENVLRNDISWYRQQALTRQMDPHFVFNTLNSIQSYIIKNDRLSSSQYLSKFARLMRLMLNNSQNHAVALSEEVSALNIYLELESLRFQEKFEYSLNVDPEIDPESCFIPAFLIQPFVENSIWHGIVGINRTGRIKIDLKLSDQGNQILCTIEDNGKGRAKSKAEKLKNDQKHKSLGVSLVESRLKLLNNLYGIEMRVDYTDLFDKNGEPAGTRVQINLPITS